MWLTCYASTAFLIQFVFSMVRHHQYIHFENCYFNCFQWHLRCRLHDALICVNFQFVWSKMIWFLMTCFFFWICLLWHVDIAPHTCICGRFYSVFIRNDILELEEAAKSFQQKKVCCTETFSVSSLFSCDRNECIKHLEVWGKIGKGILMDWHWHFKILKGSNSFPFF